MAGCSWCQTDILSSNWVDEQTWSTGCPSYDPAGLPSSVDASSIDIPSWAYLPSNWTAWIPANAQSVATGAVTPTGYLNTASATWGSSTATNTPGPQASPTPVGAIAGDAAGGVAAILLIALLVFYLLRRRRQQAEPRTPVDLSDDHPPEPSPYFLNALPHAHTKQSSSLGSEGGGTPYKPPSLTPRWGNAYAPVNTRQGAWEGSPSLSPPLSLGRPVSASSGGAGGGGGVGGAVGERDALGIPRSSPPVAPPTPVSVLSGPGGAAASGMSTPEATVGHSPARDADPARLAASGSTSAGVYEEGGGMGGEGSSTELPSYEQARAGGAQLQVRREKSPMAGGW